MTVRMNPILTVIFDGQQRVYSNEAEFTDFKQAKSARQFLWQMRLKKVM